MTSSIRWTIQVMLLGTIAVPWTRMAAAQECVGDCDGNDTVEVSNLILGVNIALERQPLSLCEAFANAQGVVDVAQLVKGVNNALHGCGPSPMVACEALSGRSLGGAEIGFARLAPAGPSHPEFCEVLGTIPSHLNFEVRLPTSWTGRALFMGNRALGGSIPAPEELLFNPSIAAAGYVSIATDGGHQADLVDGSWALDDPEAVDNWAYLSTHSVLVAARAIIAARYARAPDRTYFIGASAGGREALIAAQRWPDDFDGIVALEPVYDLSALTLAGNRVAQHVFATPGGRLSSGKVATLAQATLDACDGLDGIEDGIIGNVAACQFDPATLRCIGADTDQCLSDAQIDTVNTVHSDLTLDFALANDIRSYPAWPLGHEVAPPGPPGGWPFWITGTAVDPSSSQGFVVPDQYLRFVVTHEPALDTLHFSANDHQAALQAFSTLFDASDPDLSAFAARGGKLILWHGLADYAVSPRSTIRYYERVVSTLGGDAADSFIRFYTSPGVGHLNDGPGAGTTDFLSALTAWVETGAAPGELISANVPPTSTVPLLTRPLCRYPAYPRYESGDPHDASSFRCASSVVGTGTVASCTDAALDAALAGGGVVTFNCGGPATIDISTGTSTKVITADATVDGAGLITISGDNSAPVFHVNPLVNFVVQNLIITHGGGAIRSLDSGSLTVTNSTFTDNVATFGGAIAFRGPTLSITNSTFTRNGSYGGGAIYAEGGTLTIANSSFATNSAWGGGAIITQDTSLTIVNTTFSGNNATGDDIGKPGDGGAISMDLNGGNGSLTVINSTFVGNAASIEGGAGDAIAIGATSLATVVIRNTILTGGDDNCSRPITDGGHNLDSGTSCGFNATNGSLNDTDPQLDPAGLRDNGGPTQTVAPCTAVDVPTGCTAASPAIDTGDPAACSASPVNSLDQRGAARPGSGHPNCSMGAYEADATAP